MVPWQGIAVFPEDVARIYDSIISDNIIEGNPASHFPVLGMLLTRMERCLISGNRVSRCPGGGINAVNMFLRNTISGNAISSSAFGITLWDVASATNMAHNIVSANQIDATDFEGISVNGVNNSVIHNHITRPNRAGRGLPGIRIFLGTTNLWCSAFGNTIADASVGINLESGVLTNRIFDNHMTRVTTPVSDAGIGTIIRDNTH
jgi:parallel beta-helix repeat protein